MNAAVNMNQNPHCHGGRCRRPDGEVREVPLGRAGETGSIRLCQDCLNELNGARAEVNTAFVSHPLPLLEWEKLPLPKFTADDKERWADTWLRQQGIIAPVAFTPERNERAGDRAEFVQWLTGKPGFAPRYMDPCGCLYATYLKDTNRAMSPCVGGYTWRESQLPDREHPVPFFFREAAERTIRNGIVAAVAVLDWLRHNPPNKARTLQTLHTRAEADGPGEA